ncbi:DUF2497 domain-containing protein [uncultured Agrobacterium sp.]|uniref:PopZ family protein n=1 Tax=uncultured Agrobacterium sp. TaxID=157277 RepID=UPI0025D2E026|nr:DUF2497 domain-containing protein [uncultured Agrobacterium sp.]
MAQPSVAREPSMEEILASIRRIIESNEPAPTDGYPGQRASQFDSDDADEEMSFDGDISADVHTPPPHVPPAANQGHGARQFNEAIPASESQQPAMDPALEKTLSLADVAARVRAAADRNATLGPQAAFAQGTREQAASAAGSKAPATMQPQPYVEVERTAAAPSRPTDVRPLMAAVAQQPMREMPVFNPAPQAEQAPQPAPSAPAPQAVPLWETMELRGAVEEDRPVARPAEIRPSPVIDTVAPKNEAKLDLPLSLVSAEAGEQIARSFGALAEVFDGVHRPTIEDVAQDMLRPMLQEWLEDNLPTVVERLVREEIERVARGPRR